MRYFEARNSLIGFFGYSGNFSSRTGEAACFTPVGVGRGVNGGPCVNLDKAVEEDGWTPRVNATYKIDDDKMVYLTYSEGFRPGGINRRGTLPPYNADFLTNYEFGWKTTWAANTLRFNGALFFLKWDDIQFSYLGLNGLTEIRNAGNAEVRGLEVDLSWAATDNLTITGGFALTDTELASDYCFDASACSPPNAPAGTQLPVTPKFKGNVTARYGFPLGGMDGHVQLAAVYQGSNWADLQTADRLPLGQLAAYTTADFALGASADNYEYEFFIQNLFDKRGEVTFTTQCAINGFDGNTLCGNQPYTIPNRPRLIGFKYTQKF